MGARGRARSQAEAARPGATGDGATAANRRASFGTIKGWMGATHFLTRTLKRVSAKISLQVLADHMKCVLAILPVRPFAQAMQA